MHTLRPGETPAHTYTAPRHLPLLAEAKRSGRRSASKLWFILGMLTGTMGSFVISLVLMTAGK